MNQVALNHGHPLNREANYIDEIIKMTPRI